jgi:hypothetical protein
MGNSGLKLEIGSSLSANFSLKPGLDTNPRTLQARLQRSGDGDLETCTRLNGAGTSTAN